MKKPNISITIVWFKKGNPYLLFLKAGSRRLAEDDVFAIARSSHAKVGLGHGTGADVAASHLSDADNFPLSVFATSLQNVIGQRTRTAVLVRDLWFDSFSGGQDMLAQQGAATTISLPKYVLSWPVRIYNCGPSGITAIVYLYLITRMAPAFRNRTKYVSSAHDEASQRRAFVRPAGEIDRRCSDRLPRQRANYGRAYRSIVAGVDREWRMVSVATSVARK